MIVRSYKDEDKQYCRSLWRELTEHHREIYDDPTIGGEHPEDFFDEHLKSVGPENLWVAEDRSQIVGLTGLQPTMQQGLEIEPLVVARTHRGRGIGKMLVERMLKEARERGVKFLCMKPVARNVGTIRFLHRVGFRQLGEIELLVYFKDFKWKPGFTIHGLEFEY